MRTLVLVLTFATGFAGLVYEVVWQRYLGNLLGSQAWATALILAVFLGGLSLGYALLGKYSRDKNAKTLLHVYGIIEVLIGVYAIIFPNIFELFWQNFGVLNPDSYFSNLWDIVSAVLLIGPPTILMGGTLPILTQALSKNLNDAALLHARVYAVNTGGAVIGALGAGFILLPNFGLVGTLYAVSSINILSGLVIIILAKCSVANLSVDDTTPEIRPPRTISCLFAFLAGFTALCLQTLFMRLVALSVGASEYAFSMVVAVFVLLLALGAWLLSRNDKKRSLFINQSVAFFGAILIFFSISDWTYWAYVARTLLTAQEPNFFIYYGVIFLLLALVLAVPIGAMGRTMPLIFAEERRRMGDLGSSVGRLYSWNTLGCVLGALLGGFYFLYFFNLDRLYCLCLSLLGLMMFLGLRLEAIYIERPKFLVRQFAAILAVLIPLILPNWNYEQLTAGLFRRIHAGPLTYKGPSNFFNSYLSDNRQIFHRDDPNTTVSVHERSDAKSKELNSGASYVRSLRVNGKSDGETSFGDSKTMRLVAHLPVLLSKAPVKNVAVVGLGLGVTAGSLSLYPEIENVRIIEIAPAVVEAARYFDAANYQVRNNPKVKWSLNDAYRVLAGSKERYSLIISEPSNPWVVGVERLFARDFYELVKEHLGTDGIYTQWIHSYSLSDETLGLVIRTFAKAFPYLRIFHAEEDIIMLGSLNPLGLDSLNALKQRYEALPEVREALSQIGLSEPASLFGTEFEISGEMFEGEDEHTLEFPKLAFRAGHDFFMAADVDLADLLDGTRKRLWARALTNMSLIQGWLGQPGIDKDSAFKAYVKSACEREVLEFFPSWKRQLKTCRDGLVALAMAGVLKADFGLKKAEVDMLNQLRDDSSIDAWQQLVPRLKVEDSIQLINLFSSYESAYNSLSVKRLLLAATPCLNSDSEQAIACRQSLVEALSVAGYPIIAREVLDAIPKPAGLSSSREEQLRFLNEDSIKATKFKDFWSVVGFAK